MNIDWDYIRPIMARISIRAKRVNEKMAILEKDLLLLRGALVRFERRRASLRHRIDKIQGKQRLEEEAKYVALMGDLEFALEAMENG